MCSEDVNRGRTSGAGRMARRSCAGWALVAQARQGGELAPCGRSDSAALPPRLRSSHPAEFALGGHALFAQLGKKGVSLNFTQMCSEDRPRFTRMRNEDRPRFTWGRVTCAGAR